MEVIITASAVSTGRTVLEVPPPSLRSIVVPLLKPTVAKASVSLVAAAELATGCKLVPKSLALAGRFIAVLWWSLGVGSTALLSVVRLIPYGSKFVCGGVGTPWAAAFAGISATAGFFAEAALEVVAGFGRSLVRSATLTL